MQKRARWTSTMSIAQQIPRPRPRRPVLGSGLPAAWRKPKNAWCARINVEGKRKEKQFKPSGEDEISIENAKELAERWLAAHGEASSCLPLGSP